MSQNHEKQSYYSSLTGFKRAVPIILCALGAFMALCYFTASTGLIGGAVSGFLLGLFSYGAYAAAPLLILHGIFYPSDVAKKRVLSRFIFSVIAVLCISLISYAVFHIKAGEIKPSFMPGEYYSMGQSGEGGGLIGSILAFGIIKILGSVGLIIITCAAFAIYVAYFFTDGHGVIGKVCLAIISFFANICAFIERKIKSAFGKIKNAKTEKDKRISVAKSRDLSEDEFFMVDNGMQDFSIPNLGIKETRSDQSVEETPMLHDKVRLKSAVDEEQIEKGTLSDVHIIDGAEAARESIPEPRTQKRKILHTDFELDDAVVPSNAERPDDIIYDEPVRAASAFEDSAESVFTKDFDPFDISANEKLASKPSSRSRTAQQTRKEAPKFSEDISNITPEDIERARKQAEFDMKKRTLLEAFAKTEPAEPTFAAEDPVADKKYEEFSFSEYEETKASSMSEAIVNDCDPEDHSFPETEIEQREAEPIYEAVREGSAPRNNYERLARFSDVITEYSSSNSKAAENTASVKEEYEAPIAQAPEEAVTEDYTKEEYTTLSSRTYEVSAVEEYKIPDIDGDKISEVHESRENYGSEIELNGNSELSETLTLEHERIAPTPDDIFFSNTNEEDCSEFDDGFVCENYQSDSDEEAEAATVSDEALNDGEEDGSTDIEPEIIPEEERNPKIDEYRNMFPILDQEDDAEEEEEGGLTFEHAEPSTFDEKDDEKALESNEEPEDEDSVPPFDTEEDAEEDEDKYESAPIPAPMPKPEPPKPKKPDYSKYKFPPIDLLIPDSDANNDDINAEIEENANNLIAALEEFKVKASIKGVDRGPRITRYEIVPAAGVKVSTIMSLQDDIQLRLAAEGIRMEAPIPGKSAIGFELPNRKSSLVRLRSLLETEEFKNAKSKTMIGIGKDVAGCPVFGDTAKMPHMLIAGATGMGKSVCINSLMISMLYKARPDEVKFIMIDPKKVEFNMYNGIPHLLIPVVTDPKQAAGALMWAVEQMEKRYEMIEKMRVRNIEMYNEKVAQDPSLGEPMSKIIIVVDEFADLMLQVRDPVEGLVMSIAQKARAAGIHLIIGTQRPSVDVITGVIKANIPSRISCKVMSNTDSRTILDQKGAEDLLDKGDMLYFPAGKPKPLRVQGAFISDGEVEEIMEFLKTQGGEENYDSDVMEEITRNAQKCSKKNSDDLDDNTEDGEDSMGFLNDQKFLDAVNVAVTTGKISTSLLQRKLSIGYGKAAKYVDTMEDMGIVSESNGQKARDVLITKDEWHEKLARLSLDD